ncbi:hypothetical protein HNQ59_003165 [Chitinivorax tropicus]|uniref:VCBS repeat-containing protein n=1 Tax=Chitinivorax tropicus TaxID=714531 RepID=A0A840MRV8_9PROT|nr:hypothetical protein [Chitinivorax tropicus]MBB5019857.1 hypothetical protein [Chitinivorax tropicus]
MRIANANVALVAQSQLQTRHTTQESLRSWTGPRPEPQRPNIPPQRPRIESAPPPDPAQRTRGRLIDDDELRETDPKLYLLKLAIESMTGKKIQMFRVPNQEQPATGNSGSGSEGNVQPQPNWGAEYAYRETYYERESLSFSMNATVKTEDGKTLNVGFSFEMEREFYYESSIRLQLGNAAQRKDPLVINLDVPAAKLTDQKMPLDLDSDGRSEKVATLAPGSGYLALDKNGDGKINNGKELFGAATGDGFSELRDYDNDHNQWIDEGDTIFNKLRVWLIGADGKSALLNLKETGIGAIFLGKVDSAYALNGQQNQNLGQLKSTGFYLSDKGKAGTIQQVDLTI